MRLDPIGVLFANSWRRFQERFAVVVPIFLVPLVLMGISQLLLIQQKPGAVILGDIINILSVIVSIGASIALISAFGKGTDFGASYQTSIKLFWGWIWVVILTVLAVIGGFVMLVIPGIILSVQLAFTSYTFVLEERRGLTALAQSREYVKGYWWAYVGRSILLVVCLLAGFLILLLPTTFILGPIVGGLVYGMILLIFTPFSVAYQYEIYENLRRLKPDASAAAAKAETGFLKVSIVVGIVGGVILFILACVAAIFLPTAVVKWHATYPNGYQYSYPPTMATSTMPASSSYQY